MHYFSIYLSLTNSVLATLHIFLKIYTSVQQRTQLLYCISKEDYGQLDNTVLVQTQAMLWLDQGESTCLPHSLFVARRNN